jgi:thioredoxin reductase (NADPH)
MRRSWDVVVIGAGVAGMSAARAVAEQGLRCACIDRLGPGGVLINLGLVHGLQEETTGPDLVAALLDAAMAAGAELVIGEVSAISGGPPWLVRTEEDEHEARAVIIATGLSPGTLGLPNEQEFEGRGLSHCAACDGPLYVGKPVVVSGSDKWALQEALELAAVASEVTVIGDADPGALSVPNITMAGGRIAALHGDEVLARIEVERDGQRRAMDASGVFAYADRRPLLGFASVAVDAGGRAVVDADGHTSIRGVFAIGDVRAGATETVAESIADGERAGLAAARLLTQHDAM